MSDRYVLKLYIAGATPAANRAIANLKEICAVQIGESHYEIEVVDILMQPEQAEEQRILATPTLIKHLPPPIRKIIGDLADHERVLASLDIIAT